MNINEPMRNYKNDTTEFVQGWNPFFIRVAFDESRTVHFFYSNGFDYFINKRLFSYGDRKFVRTLMKPIEWIAIKCGTSFGTPHWENPS